MFSGQVAKGETMGAAHVLFAWVISWFSPRSVICIWRTSAYNFFLNSSLRDLFEFETAKRSQLIRFRWTIKFMTSPGRILPSDWLRTMVFQLESNTACDISKLPQTLYNNFERPPAVLMPETYWWPLQTCYFASLFGL